MRVFRCITAREIYNKYKGINERKALIAGNNTHNYKKGTDYIHFFEFSKDAETFYETGNYSMNELDHFVAYMVANIPYEVLKPYFGYGIYGTELPNMDYAPVPEYAIPLELFKEEYIITISQYIPSKYKNDENFQKYIEYMQNEYDLYGSWDGENIAYHLLDYDLHEKADIPIDDRTEKEIFKEELKVLSRVMEDLKHE